MPGIDRLSELVQWMRERGVTKLRTEEAELELGPEPRAPDDGKPTLSSTETPEEEAKRLKEEQDELLFASS